MISKRSAFYRATEFCSVMWDTFRGRSTSNPTCVSRRLPLGTMDICTVGRVYLFTLLYFAYFAALIAVSTYFMVISPLEGLPDWSVGAASVLKWITIIVIVVSLGAIGFFAIKYARRIKLPAIRIKREPVVKREKIDQPVKQRSKFWMAVDRFFDGLGHFWAAIKLRYKAFKERTCFYLEVEGAPDHTKTTKKDTI